MKYFGILIFFAGILLCGYALNMDTSVAVNNRGNIFGLPDRVNNLGLMQDKQNYLILSGILILAGLVMFVAAKPKNKKLSKNQYSHFELAKKAEYKGEYKEAIHHYVECLFEIEKQFTPSSKKRKQEKLETIESLRVKIEKLKAKLPISERL
jgi:hypothetical protein